nr:MAG TPA: hypothetical protein [Bacteriophage sp.]
MIGHVIFSIFCRRPKGRFVLICKDSSGQLYVPFS